MEEVAFQDWPGQPVDLNSGNNPWMPAYGFQTPSSLLEKDDFAGNPDAEYFLHTTAGHYMYLETIQEETSDDLKSDSDVESRNSPTGWFATDSDSGSVIRIEQTEDLDCDSDRELACPAKRRKQDLYLSLPVDDDETSLSRSSSLLQFETLEKQCQENSSSPSIFSQFSFDSLEITVSQRKEFSRDDFSPDYDAEFFKSIRIDVPRSKQNVSRDSLLYNVGRSSGSDSSDSDTTLDGSKSCDNLKTWRSFDSLPLNSAGAIGKKFSSENLSEDSGYGDQLMLVNKSGSVGNLNNGKRAAGGNMTASNFENTMEKTKRNSYVGFGAYDGDVFQNFNGNFGVSYQDLSIFDRLDPLSGGEPLSKTSPLTDHFLRKKQRQQMQNIPTGYAHAINLNINLDRECGYSNFNEVAPHAASAPDLLDAATVDVVVVATTSVPKDLNFVGQNQHVGGSVAEQNLNLADISFDSRSERDSVGDVANDYGDVMGSYRREGSYDKAMSNRVDLSDDETSLTYRKKLPKSPIVEFDRRVLNAISEQSLVGSTPSLHGSRKYLEASAFATSTPNNAAVSTPDLNRIEPATRRERAYYDDDRRKSTQEICSKCGNFESVSVERKGSIIKSSTSTSGMSDVDEKTLRNSVRSFTGSTGSKGVHFSPVVDEMKWRDDNSISTATPERESSYSLDSSSPEPLRNVDVDVVKLVKPKPRYGNGATRRSVSQPDLSDTEAHIYKQEFIDSLHSLRQQDLGLSKSQPEISKFKRRGSQLIKRDKDGCTIKAYVDVDGVQYQHTHLDLPGGAPTGTKPDAAAGSDAKSRFPSIVSPSSSVVSVPHNFVAVEHQQSKQACVGKQTKGDGAVMSAGARSSKKKGLGGFLQRLASFRLGVKKGQEQKEKLKRKKNAATQQGNGAAPLGLAGSNNVQPGLPGTKPDYVYIPLKGPPTSDAIRNNNNAAPVSSKPPLPKQPPPRVVHASVKKSAAAQNPHFGVGVDERRRRRTIDSASVTVATSKRDVGDGVVGIAGDASMEGPMGLIETDLDTEVTVITNAKARSLLNLGPEPRLTVPPNHREGDSKSHPGRPHKSMEFLLDKENLKVVEPPENELQKTERVMSEHELRVQRSLQKLTVPDWYKQSQVPREGFLLKKHPSREARWTGTSSKTTSLSSLGSGVQSPLMLSPTPCNQPFVRWSTSKLNSTASSPCQSTRSSFNTGSRQPNGSISPSSVRSSFSYRQPYMGWRSQERLSRPRTPAERLASSLLAQQSQSNAQQQHESPEIQTSIKEVTSAIVHYVSGLKPHSDERTLDNNQDAASRRSSSVSPRGSQKLCWLESSFVGTKPLDSPETPVTCSENSGPPQSLKLDLRNHSSKDMTMLSTDESKMRPSPSSTTLEDVLDSLLGLPSSGKASSPCLQETATCNEPSEL
ncbi:uncharacterized protein LOC132702599 isoform X2 [Cylas formicarius]|uniref:uncharacterized protein LOC132702599 isoform X2 n=1 Tax=Cylas formicarius TaxID=197179 RepID=UPI002958DA3A|nr:uncharacterized protein LOC132702599 isoform X2 [Cylas formicarius]